MRRNPSTAPPVKTGMRLTTIQILAALLSGIALVFAFLAGGVAAASALLAILVGASLAWLGWRLGRRRLSHPRDRTA